MKVENILHGDAYWGSPCSLLELGEEGEAFKLRQQKDQTQLCPISLYLELLPIKQLDEWPLHSEPAGFGSAMSVRDPSQALLYLPVWTQCLLQIRTGWSEAFVQCEHLDACSENFSLFHHGDERAALKPQINCAFAAQEKLLLILCTTQEPPKTFPQGYHLWDGITSFGAGVRGVSMSVLLGARGIGRIVVYVSLIFIIWTKIVNGASGQQF